MHFKILTIFPDMINDYASQSILGRGQKAGAIGIKAIDIRDFASESMLAHSTVLTGESPGSLENLFTVSNEVEVVSFRDDSSIDIERIVYNKRTKRFEARVKNTGDDVVYVGLEIEDMLIDDQRSTLASSVSRIPPGESADMKIIKVPANPHLRRCFWIIPIALHRR